MSIITKTGNGGESRFLGGMVSKGGVGMEAIGALDELSATLQVAKSKIKNQKSKLNSKLKNIIEDLWGIMGEMATGKRVISYQLRVMSLEKEIEETEKKLPKQNKFLIFEKEGAVYLNWARTVARRAERRLVKYYKKCQNLDPNILIYINRLSDYLFIKAREVEYKS